jgi:sporulation protein YlmC with PRC-barrel domain
MLRNVNNLSGYAIIAKDGELGKVSEFFFDDYTWSIRYLVVETGSWLSERKVLIPHSALGVTNWDARTFNVNLTMEQVRNSPDIETQKTVSRQHEIELLSYYALPVYWGDALYAGPAGMAPLTPIIASQTIRDNAAAAEGHDDPNLRSTKKVTGYYIEANDGEIGHVGDFIVDDNKWNIHFLVVDTNNWLPGRKVLIMPFWIDRINWEESKVYINLSKEFIKNSPEFDPSKPIDKYYEKELLNHYGEHKKQH